jgi:protein-S-isoprenylcysteine O-methyltransferase Ste14
VTTGVFTFSRNRIYTAFAFILLGEFLIFPNWILLLYLVAALWLFHRQVLREEEFLRGHYGEEYAEYCRRVRRYL